jgi:hypothetical protein
MSIVELINHKQQTSYIKRKFKIEIIIYLYNKYIYIYIT